MKLSIIAVIAMLLLCGSATQAQDDVRSNEDKYLEEVETPPEIIGGISELSKHVQYPKDAAKEGVEGTVILKVWVNEKGGIDNLDVENADKVDKRLQKSALEAVGLVEFKPGMHQGEAVKCIVMVPVKYRLK